MSRIKDAWNVLTKKALPKIGGTYQFMNGTFVGIQDNRKSYIANGYDVNDSIYAIVNLITDKVRIPDWDVYQIEDEEAFKTYEGIMRKKDLTIEDIKLAQKYKKKSLKPVYVDRLSELMKYPNDYETMQDLVANSTGYKLIVGGRAIWGELLNMGANEGKPYALHNLPYDQLSIIANINAFPIQEEAYQLDALLLPPFPKQQVLHDKYQNYDWDVNGSHLYGMSPLKAALRRLSRSNSAVKASASMLENQGVKGVLYMDDPRVLSSGVDAMETAKQVNAVKAKLVGEGEWRGSENWGRIGVSGYKLGWQEIGLTAVDLDIIDSEKWDLKRFAAVYGVPAQLVGDSETSTYNNVREAEKALTTRCAIPQLVSFRNHLNRKLQTDWGYAGQPLFVDFDQTCFTELQEDIKEKSTWVNTLKGLSPNEQRDLLGLETIEHPIFDEPWITPDMGMPLSEWAATEGGVNPADVPAWLVQTEESPMSEGQSEDDRDIQEDSQSETMKAAGEKISFDYDGVLTKADIRKKAIRLKEGGATIYIISARSEKASMLEVASEIGVPASRVYATGSNKEKVAKIKDLNISKHYDNNPDVLKEVRKFTKGELVG